MARHAVSRAGDHRMRRGEIWSSDLDPVIGREQAGRRPVLIVSADAFNVSNAPYVCPITSGGVLPRLAGLAVSLATCGTRTTGVVLCNQLRVLDLRARKARRIEVAPDYVVDEVLAKLVTIFE